MKQNFFKLLIGLMSISIIGLVIVQLYWLNQAFEAGKFEFDGRFYKALDATVNTVNEMELNQYYAIFEKTKNSPEASKQEREIITSQIENDSASTKYVYMTRIFKDKIAVPISGLYNDSLNVTELYSSDRAIRVKKDSGAGFEPLPVNLDAEFSGGSYTIERFARFDAGNKPIYQRVSIRQLDSILARNMKQWNVKTKVELGIIGQDSTKIALKSEKFELNKQNFMIPLFFDKDNQATYFLSAYLPQKNQTIFNSILGLFAVTVLFTLVILGVYATSIYGLLRQRKISQMKTDFLNNMTHEFKTPIATIGVATDALRNQMISSNPDKVKHYAQLIKQENKRMNNQVEMVLRMAQLERNQIKIEPTEVHVNDLVQESVDAIRLIVENRNGTIIEEYKAEKDLLSVDTFHLGNIVLNVLDNANKYSPESPEIKVSTYNTQTHFVVEISDKGIGMSKAVQAKIFEKFYREETGNVHNVKGHGLGLAYVKHIMDLHMGEVIVKSEKGKGSTFYLQIPLN